MITACYVAWNEADLIGESIRSVLAYVDRFVVVDGAFSTNPAGGPVGSRDGMREVVERAVCGKPLTYIVPPGRLEEHMARNLALALVGAGEWALLMDADEILCGDHEDMRVGLELGLKDPPPDGALNLPIYTTAILFNGNADEMDREQFETAPIVGSVGDQPRLVRMDSTVHYQREEIGPGIFTHANLWRGSDRVWGMPWGEWSGLDRPPSLVILNRHVSQPFEDYQADYAWETAQRDGAR